MNNDEVASPCINVCVIDDATGLCTGCMRTADEIADWGSKPSQTKREILSRLNSRRAQLRQTESEQE